LSEKALSQGIGRPVLLSLSRTIETHRKQYYAALQTGQQDNEITDWVTWFVNMGLGAQIQAEEQVEFTLRKTKLFDRWKDEWNERQLQVLQRMLEEGPKGFKGGMNAKKYVAVTGTSKATATRDLQDLVKIGVFIPAGGGRSTRYEVKL
jgi:Fic family protein